LAAERALFGGTQAPVSARWAACAPMTSMPQRGRPSTSTVMSCSPVASSRKPRRTDQPACTSQRAAPSSLSAPRRWARAFVLDPRSGLLLDAGSAARRSSTPSASARMAASTRMWLGEVATRALTPKSMVLSASMSSGSSQSTSKLTASAMGTACGAIAGA